MQLLSRQGYGITKNLIGIEEKNYKRYWLSIDKVIQDKKDRSNCVTFIISYEYFDINRKLTVLFTTHYSISIHIIKWIANIHIILLATALTNKFLLGFVDVESEYKNCYVTPKIV